MVKVGINFYKTGGISCWPWRYKMSLW